MITGCAPKAGPAVSVSVLVRGDAEAVAAIKVSLEKPVSPAVETRVVELSSEPPTAPKIPDLDARLANARTKYLAADFSACLEAIGGESALRDLLFEGKRTAATRLLLWRVACLHGAGSEAEALTVARTFASLGLEVPSEVTTISPKAEQLLARAIGDSARAARVTMSVATNVSPASLALDGNANACSLPCSVQVAPGEHVLRIDADGAVPAMRDVRVSAATTITIPTSSATPGVAALQWSTRYASLGDVDSAPSMRLLATALRAQRLALLQAERDPDGLRLRGAIVNSGEIAARGERRAADLGAAAPALMRDLLVRGKVIEKSPLVRRPAFWLALAAGVLVTGATTAAFLYQPPVTTRIRFEQDPGG